MGMDLMTAVDGVTGRTSSRLTSPALGSLLALVLAACAGLPTGSAVASTAATIPAASPTPAVSGGTAAAYCAFIVEIHTKAGDMKNRTYTTGRPSIDVERQVVTESLSRLAEWVADTPPEIKVENDDMIAYFQRLKAYGDVHGWTDWSGFPILPDTDFGPGVLFQYQARTCRIGFPLPATAAPPPGPS